MANLLSTAITGTLSTTGNVGIGTTAPTDTLGYGKALDIQSSSGAAVYLRDSDATSVYGIIAYDGNTTNRTTIGGIGASNYLRFVSEGNEAMRITSGNVGIGTTAPSYKLHVDGTGLFIADSVDARVLRLRDRAANGGNIVQFEDGSGTGVWEVVGRSNEFYIYKNTGTGAGYKYRVNSNGDHNWDSGKMFLVNSSGSLGIGTTSPAAKLDVAGDIRLGGTATYNSVSVYNNSASGGGGYLAYQNGVANAYFGAAGWYIGNSDTGAVIGTDSSSRPIRFYTSTERMRITGGGNVGIGTTNPAGKLSVEGDGTEYSNIVFKQSAAQEHLLYASTNIQYNLIGSGGPIWIWGQQGGSEIMRLNNTGLGIGTSPSYKLDVAGGNVRFVAAASTDALVRIIAANYATEYDARLFLGENDTNGMTIEYDGSANVGFIGMNSSTEPTGAFSKRIRMSRDGSEVSFPVGNVGIGTTAPGTKLHVVGGNDNTLTIDNDGSTYTSAFWRNNNNNRAQIYFQNGAKEFGIGTLDASGYLAFQTGVAAERMRITSAGNVGIGTTSPVHKTEIRRLETVNRTTYTDILSINADANNAPYSGHGGGILFRGQTYSGSSNNNQGNRLWGRIGMYLNDSYDNFAGESMFFAVAPDDRSDELTTAMTIRYDGNVGIGTTSPSNKLTVEDTIGIKRAGVAAISTIQQTGTGLIVNAPNGYHPLVIQHNSSELFRFTNGGNLGIGTTSPGAKLEVKTGSAYTGNSDTNIKLTNAGYRDGELNTYTEGSYLTHYFENFTGGNGRYYDRALDIVVKGSPDGTYGESVIKFKLNPITNGSNVAEVMRITGAGRVGIGTNSPKSRLDLGVASSQSTISTLGYSANAALNIRIPNSVGDVGQIVFTNDAAPTAGYASIGVVMTSGTGVGLGDIVFATKSVGSDAASTERMRINSSGNVGIGVTSIDMGLQIGDGKGLLVGPSSSSGSMYVSPTDENTINGSWGIAEDTADIWLNYRGYRDGFDYFRDTRIGNGKGTAIVMVDGSAGNVGIGTTSPATNLHVYSTEQKDTIGHIQYENANTGTGAATNAQLIGKSKYGTLQYMVWESNGARIGMRSTANSGSGNLYFTVGTDSVSTTMLANGNVGIGTTDTLSNKLLITGSHPSGYSILGIKPGGDQVATLGFYNSGGTRKGLIYTTSDYLAIESDGLPLYFNPNGSVKGVWNTAGNLGIGTTNPQVELHVKGNNGWGEVRVEGQTFASGHGGSLEFYSEGTALADIYANTSKDLILRTNGSTERMRITAAGNVGIAASSPTHKLNVYDAVTNQYTIRVQSETGNGAGKWMGIGFSGESANNKGAILFQSYGTSYSRGRMIFALNNAQDQTNATPSDAIMSLEANGRVGIGTTSPSYKLDIATANDDAIRITNSLGSNSNGLALAVGSGTPWMDFAGSSFSIKYNTSLGSWNSGANAHFTILSGGNVGIGTTSPSDKLDVSGNARTSGYVLVNNHSDNTLGYRISNTSGTAVSAMFVNSSNQLVIAAGAVDQVNLNKKVLVNGVALGVNVAPSATAGRIDASNDIVAYSSSDERLKQNITPIENALEKVKSLTGVEFDWKPEYKDAHGYEGHDTGIIAQQVEAVMPSAVRTNDTGFLAVRYEKLIGLLIEGMKEQQAQIDELKAKLDGLTK